MWNLREYQTILSLRGTDASERSLLLRYCLVRQHAPSKPVGME